MARSFKIPINLVNLADNPLSGGEGDIYYNTTDDRIKVYKNSSWVSLAYSDDVGITNIDYITFDTTPESVVPATTGTMSWDVDNETIKVQLPNMVLQLGQEHIVRVKNDSGLVAIPNGTLVMFAGATGDTIKVKPAITNDVNVYPSDYIVGVTTNEIPANGFGEVTQFGFVNNVDTNSWTVGTMLWPDPNIPGGLISTRPPAPAWQTPIAAVTKQNASAGRLMVRIIPGIQLGNVEGVEITSPQDNNALFYQSSNKTWVNKDFGFPTFIQSSQPVTTFSKYLWWDTSDIDNLTLWIEDGV